ncbi:hypothetical protein DFS34DRAFT_595601 [Phlyctochytrium arcticum]|nr:hypothetical protein DFS34DRAFT_595601 [Phlyctochytrium arcticum]
MSWGGLSNGSMTGNLTDGGYAIDKGSSNYNTVTRRDTILDAWETAIGLTNCYLIFTKFMFNRSIHFNPTRRWSTMLQLLWLAMYFLKNVGTLAVLFTLKNPLEDTPYIQINIFWAGYASFLMISYKTLSILSTYFRHVRADNWMDKFPDGVYFALTVALLLSYIRTKQYFSSSDYRDFLTGYFEYNIILSVLALISIIATILLVGLIVQAERNRMFNSIIINRSLFYCCIALQIAALIFYDILTFVQLAGEKQVELWLWTVASIAIDSCIFLFENNHKKLFIDDVAHPATQSYLRKIGETVESAASNGQTAKSEVAPTLYNRVSATASNNCAP